MNSIPVVGPDSGIAPRTGSGSPQTPSQQRADAAPAVLSDTGVSADPGVMLKIAPPVLSRDANPNVDQRLPADQLAAFLAKQQLEKQGVVLALGNSAEQADQALVERLAQALSALPTDVQDAIRNASTPAIAQLLKLAALTSSGIKDAPAILQAASVPAGPQPDLAATALLEDIAQSHSFRLASALRGVFQDLSFGVRRLTPEESYLGKMQQLPAEQYGGGDGTREGVPLGRISEKFSPGNHQMQSTVSGEQKQTVQQPTNPLAIVGLELSRNQNAANAYQEPNQALLRFIDQVVSSPADESVGLANQGASNFIKESASSIAPVNQGAQAITSQEAELGLREGLKLLMDGRMVWQGEFTPGVPLRLERSDAWQADRKGFGGMDKGTSLRLQLRLPSVGLVEIRALGFQGQVSVRVHAESKSTAAFAGGLPDLIARLKQRGLSAAQVVVDSL